MLKLITRQTSADRSAAESGNDDQLQSRDEEDMFEILLSAIHELIQLNK